MTTQSEAVLENELIAQLQRLGYARVKIPDEKALLANLKSQLEKHNQKTFSEKDFQLILNHLGKGSIFQKAHTLRDKFSFENEEGETVYVEFLNTKDWCQNEFQVANQITMEGKRVNRYDVTLLINGLPLVQVELKKRGLELKEAFNQTHRYQRHSYRAGQGLFEYIQIFVISNGVNTKYYANNRSQSFRQTFYWSDRDNHYLTQLSQFAEVFLEPCHLSKMICKYIVLHQSDKILMVLRPYQFHAVEAIIQRVVHNSKNGYIWHTTGSGKTLTSFKASQIIQAIPEIHKVIFVVDRKDLDYQTIKEFNYFAEGSIDGTDNTKILVQQFTDTYKDKKGVAKDNKLIVTTIQKLNTAIHKKNHLAKMQPLRDKNMVFIFDECHRSQFGETHRRIKDFFQNIQMFGFTGTPIFADNAIRNELGKRTTAELFEDCLHKYVITDAIKAENVLRFSIEYVGRYKYKDESKNNLDIEVEDIDRKELIESPQRLEKIADYIIAQHSRKTQREKFNAIFCVSSIEMLIRYYEIFKKKREQQAHELKIATVFSYGANEASLDLEGGFDRQDFNQVAEGGVEYQGTFAQDKLEAYIKDYNQLFGTDHSLKSQQGFYVYNNDISKRIKEHPKLTRDRQIDLLLVVNMFLTGFDSKTLNTLYVDKNLRYHGLIQAYSRTNRTYDETKRHGNIVVFRNLKKATDEAIALFSNKEAKEEIILEPYENYVEKFKVAVQQLKAIAPTVDSVNEFPSEEEELQFVKAFRALIRVQNVISTFSDFDYEDVGISEQEIKDYQSKYLDIHSKVKNLSTTEKDSILDEVDFELELIQRDNITIVYILRLLGKLKEAKAEERKAQRKKIMDLLDSQVHLRSKKELIEKFINQNLPQIEDENDIEIEFDAFLSIEQKAAYQGFCQAEQLDPEGFEAVIKNYLFKGEDPLANDIIQHLAKPPSILKRQSIVTRVTQKMKDFVETYYLDVEG